MKKITAFILTLAAAISLIAGMTSCSGGNFDESKEISVVSREDGSGTRGAFIELFAIEVKNDDGAKTDHTTKDADVVNNTETMITSVANNVGAIGYISLGSLNDSVKALDIDGVKATSANVKNGTYKISRPFNIATKTSSVLSEVAQDFINYILSKEGQEVAAKDYIAINDSASAFAGTSPSGKIVVAGSSSVSPVMEKLKEAYAAVNPNATIEIQTSDSSTGINSAIEGTCDICMASRDLKESEAGELTAISIAIDGIAVIVNSKNSNDNLSKEQVKNIFTGEINVWSGVK